MAKLHIKKGDRVKAIAGDEKGKEGRVLSVLVKKQKAVVEGLNKVSRHTRKDAKNPKGGIITKEAPIHISNLLVVDPQTGEHTRVGRKLDKDGKLTRYSKKSGEFLK